jgi:predicted nucleotidyltransferase
MIQTKEELLHFLQIHKKELQEKFNITQLGVFGSFARNEVTTESDIDLLVDFKPQTPNLYAIKKELKGWLRARLGRSVDLCRIKFIREPLRTHLLTDAVYV